MLNFHIQSLIWFMTSVTFMIIIFMTSKWGIKKLFIIFKVNESWYNVMTVICSIIKVLFIAGSIIFIASRIFFHDVTVKSFDSNIGTQTEQYNQKQLENYKAPDPNMIEQLNKELDKKREMELNNKILEKNRKTRDEFQKYLDTL